jgi:hypothetical protein
MPSVIMLSVLNLSVVLLSVAMPKKCVKLKKYVILKSRRLQRTNL